MMKIINIENSDDVDINMTSLQGRIMATRAELIEAFGEPTISGTGDKTTIEWLLEFTVESEFGTGYEYVVASIYDWKETETPNGAYLWHIGGHNHKSVDCVHAAMEMQLEIGESVA